MNEDNRMDVNVNLEKNAPKKMIIPPISNSPLGALNSLNKLIFSPILIPADASKATVENKREYPMPIPMIPEIIKSTFVTMFIAILFLIRCKYQNGKQQKS